MATQRLGIIMNGVTGRMGMNQHLIRSIVAIRDQGGVTLANGDRVMPDPILIGRNAEKIARTREGARHRSAAAPTRASTGQPRRHGVLRRRHHADAPGAADAGHRSRQARLLREAGRHQPRRCAGICSARAQAKGIKHGVVQDKLFLPGLMKLKMLIDSGFFGRMLSVRGEFGYWVFEGDLQPAQRPSWNYRSEDGGGIILDMLCHWRYVLDNLFGEVKSVSCLGATHIPERFDEAGKRYQATADDAAYATFELAARSGERVIAQINSSWTTRVRRDDLVTFHVDGTHGSAVAGLHECRTQSRVNTPKPVWNPDVQAAARLLRALAAGARVHRLRQRLQDAVGGVHPPRRRRRAVQVEPARRRQGRAARRVRIAQLEGAALDRRASAGDLTARSFGLTFAIRSSSVALARRGGRYPMWAPTVAVGLAGRLRCDARAGVAPRNSLRSLRSLCSNNRGESDERSALRAPTPTLRFSPPHKSPPPGTAHRAAAVWVFDKEHGGAGKAGGGCASAATLRDAEERRARGRARAARASSSDSSRLSERSERSERSEFRDGPRDRVPQGSRPAGLTVVHERRRIPARGFASLRSRMGTRTR